MSRVLFAAKHVYTVLRMSRPLFVGRHLFAGHVVSSRPMERKKKFTNDNYNSRARPLFCSLNLFFCDVLVTVAVVFCVRSLNTNGRIVSLLQCWSFSVVSLELLWFATLIFTASTLLPFRAFHKVLYLGCYHQIKVSATKMNIRRGNQFTNNRVVLVSSSFDPSATLLIKDNNTLLTIMVIFSFIMKGDIWGPPGRGGEGNLFPWSLENFIHFIVSCFIFQSSIVEMSFVPSFFSPKIFLVSLK